jgi:hypothetical protein
MTGPGVMGDTSGLFLFRPACRRGYRGANRGVFAMNRLMVPGRLLVLLGAAVLAWSAPKPAEVLAKPTAKDISLEDNTALKVALAKPIAKDISFEGNTPLKVALDAVAKTFDLTIRIDTQAFQKAGVKDVGAQPIQLPNTVKVQRGTALQLLVSQVRGSYRLEKGQVVIVPRPKGQTLADLLPPPSKAIQAQLKQQTDKAISFDANTPLKEALAFLGDLFDLTIAFDEEAFRTAKVAEIGLMPVKLAKQPPSAILGPLLEQVLKQAGATYLVRDEMILVVPSRK